MMGKRGMTAALLATVTALAAVPATASAIPYQRWAQAPANTAGVVFHPYGDKFEIWDNYADLQGSYVIWRYSGSRNWHRGGSVRDRGHKVFNLNMRERRIIVFRLYTGGPDANPVKYRTSGR
jgi:hypothetical protein